VLLNYPQTSTWLQSRLPILAEGWG
jgi:hypothetical protein